MNVTSPGGLGLAAATAAPEATTREFPLCPVATHKFVVLCVCTLGLYQLYWFYSNWRRIADGSNEIVSPFWRTVFCPIWSFSLFDHIRTYAEQQELSVRWTPVLLGSVFLLLTLAIHLPEPWDLMSLASCLPLLPAQRTAQRINDRYRDMATEPRNDTYSIGNIVVIVFGSIMVVLTILATLLAE